MRRFAFLVFFLFLSIECHAANTHKQAAVIDSGSSGTRLHVFEWDEDDYKQPQNIHEVFTKKITPGITSIDNTSTSINSYLRKLFESAPGSNMPVYYYATAGMRLIPRSLQDKYYQNVTQWFQDNPNYTLISARTITGHEEGLYGWLSVNYATGALQNRETALVGVLDMGGASVQISFPVTDRYVIRPDDIDAFSLYGQSFKVFTHSFLGLGQNEASHQFLNVDTCYPYDYVMPNGDEGNGSFLSCTDNVNMLINQVHHVRQYIPQILAHNPISKWFVMGGLQSIVKQKMFHFKGKQFTPSQLMEQGNMAACQQSWLNLEVNYQDNPYVYNYCMLTAYYYALLSLGYGLSSNQPLNYDLPQPVSDWTMGVILHKYTQK